MFEYFRFSLPRAVTEQLIERLGELSATSLTDEALRDLATFQTKSESARGVYVIYQAGAAVYAGKSDGLAERLGEHLWKLRGRSNLNLETIAFKALVLDENWSTSANEGLLIQHFKLRGECRWNGSGFGPKDPGKNRDGAEPSWFDENYPVLEDFPVPDVPNQINIGVLLEELKNKAPYLFRYDVPAADKLTLLDITGVPRTVKALAFRAATTLGTGWQLMLFKNGFTLYKANRPYPNGQQLFPLQ